MKPGTIVLPVASMRCAPAGMVVEFAGPDGDHAAAADHERAALDRRAPGAVDDARVGERAMAAPSPAPARATAGTPASRRRAACPATGAVMRMRLRIMEISCQVAVGRGSWSVRLDRKVGPSPPTVRLLSGGLRREQFGEVAPRHHACRGSGRSAGHPAPSCGPGCRASSCRASASPAAGCWC